VVALAVVTSAGWAAPPVFGARRRLWPLAVAAVAALYGQIVLGALATHAGWVGLHLAGAVVATAATAALARHVLGRRPVAPPLARLAAALAGLLILQVALGVGAYAARMSGLAVPGGAAVALALPVVHRATASLLLGAAVAFALHVWRLRPTEGARTRAPLEPDVLSRGAAA